MDLELEDILFNGENGTGWYVSISQIEYQLLALFIYGFLELLSWFMCS